MIVVDGRIDDEKLRELLATGGEQQALDFKAKLDLGDTPSKLEFVKDALSMGNLPTGGYIVLGVNDKGLPAHDQPVLDLSRRAFDPSKLRDLVKNWCEAPVNITSAAHQVDGRDVVVVFVAPNPDGLPVPASKTATAGDTVVFREGEVLLREGTSNVRLRYAHWHQLLGRYREGALAESRRDVDALIHRVVQSQGTNGSPGRVPLDAAMDAGTLISAVTALFDAGRTVEVRRFLSTAKATASSPQNSGERDHSLDNIALVACQSVLYDQTDAFEAAVEALWRVYISGGSSPEKVLATGTDRDTAEHLLAVILRVLAIGALTVREKKWAYLPTLVLRRLDVSGHYGYSSWLRHALVYAARTDLLQGDDGQHRGGQALSLASTLVAHRAAFRPDYASDIALPASAPLASDNWVLNSLCQFDLWWCVISQASTGADATHGGVFYPSCAAFHQHRSQSAIETIALDAQARGQAFPDRSDETTAVALSVVVEVAARESRKYGGFWTGLDENPRVTDWMVEHVQRD